jgi:protein-L-isoaspartate(D-aspartate) O-methyltransferase
MKDYEAAQKKMVAQQLEARGIKDARVLSAMGEIPRHLFVGASNQSEAYDDNPLPIGKGQTISQPYMVAFMTELLMLQGNERVLEIGTGSGYQAAILSRLCKWVYTIERIVDLSKHAQEVLKTYGFENISFKIGDGSGGWPEESPFDGIMVTAGAPVISDVLVDQLTTMGKLIIPVGDRFSQTLKRVIKTRTGIKVENHTGCRFVDLIGEHGWS